MRNLRTLVFLLEKEIKQIFRNKVILPMIIILPTIQLLLLPFAATFEIRHIKIAVVDQDQSSLSKRLIEKIRNSPYFILEQVDNSYPEALNKIEASQASLLLQIPRNFEKELVNAIKPAEVLVAVDAVDGTSAGMGANYVAEILQHFTKELHRDRPSLNAFSSTQNTEENTEGQTSLTPNMPNTEGQTSLTPNISSPLPLKINFQASYRFNQSMNYKTYMVPGIIVMMLTLVGGILAAMNIVYEKEQGTLEQINVSPVKRSHYLLGKLIPFWIMGFVTLSIGLLVARVIYGIIPLGSLGLIYFASGLYMLAFTGFGLLISISTQNQQQAMFIAFFFLMIFFLMGGLFTPISSMPKWAQHITILNPTAYMIDIMRLIVLKGSTYKDVLPQLGMCGLFALFFNTWAILSYKKTN